MEEMAGETWEYRPREGMDGAGSKEKTKLPTKMPSEAEGGRNPDLPSLCPLVLPLLAELTQK